MLGIRIRSLNSYDRCGYVKEIKNSSDGRNGTTAVRNVLVVSITICILSFCTALMWCTDYCIAQPTEEPGGIDISSVINATVESYSRITSLRGRYIEHSEAADGTVLWHVEVRCLWRPEMLYAEYEFGDSMHRKLNRDGIQKYLIRYEHPEGEWHDIGFIDNTGDPELFSPFFMGWGNLLKSFAQLTTDWGTDYTLSETTLEGTDCYLVEVSSNRQAFAGYTGEYWIRKTDYVPLRVVTYGSDGTIINEMTIDYQTVKGIDDGQDYTIPRKVSGNLMYHSQSYFPSTDLSNNVDTITFIGDWEVNGRIDADEFAMTFPAGMRVQDNINGGEFIAE